MPLTDVDNALVPLPQCCQEVSLMRKPLGLNQLGFIAVFGARQRRFQVHQIESGQVLALQIVHQIRCGIQHSSVALLHVCSLLLMFVIDKGLRY